MRVRRMGLATAILVFAGLMGGTAPDSLADDWPQWLGPHRDGIWREPGVLTEFPEEGPAIRWRAPLGAGYAGPAVAAGRVYVMDRIPERSEDGQLRARPDGSLPGTERVVCLDSRTGEVLWIHEYPCAYRISYPSGPRATPLVDGDRVYCLGAMGNLKCLEAANGKVVWSVDFVKDFGATPPVWGWAAHPLLDGDRLLCVAGGKGAAVVALDKQTGQVLWKSMTVQETGYAPPVLYEPESPGKRQLIFWYDVGVSGLDPDDGTVLWTVPFPKDRQPVRPVVPIMTPRIAGRRLLVSDFYDGSLVLQLDPGAGQPKVVWSSDVANDPRLKNSLNALMVTPVVRGKYVYGVSGDGELRCLELATGELLWRDVQPTGEKPAYFATCFLVPHSNGYWYLFNDQGYLIVAKIGEEGYEEVGRAKILEPTGFTRGRHYVWSHPALAGRAAYWRNDKEIVCVDLSRDQGSDQSGP